MRSRHRGCQLWVALGTRCASPSSYVPIKSLLVIVVCLAFSNASAQDDVYRYVVTGRAVDQKGIAVPQAMVSLVHGPGETAGDSIYVIPAADDGSFRYEIPICYLVKSSRMMYVSGREPEHSITWYPPPYSEYPLLKGTKYAGRRILIKKNGQVDVGDVVVRVFYGVVNVHLQDRAGKPLHLSSQDWRTVVLRIKDRRGRILQSGNFSRRDVSENIDLSTTSFRFGFPEGQWWMEISLHEDAGPWVKSIGLVRISASAPPRDVVFRFRR